MAITRLKRPRNYILVFIIIAAIFIIIDIYLYKTTFGNIKSDTNTWAQFGDYFGGTLGPLFSFITFIGLLWTISLSYEQLSIVLDDNKRQKTQEKKDDLYKIIQTIHAELKELLIIERFCIAYIDKSIIEIPADIKTGINISFFDILKMDRSKLSSQHLYDKYKYYLIDIAKLIFAMKIYALKYEILSQDKIVSDFYRITYIDTAHLLREIKLIGDETLNFYTDLKYITNFSDIKINNPPGDC